MPKHIPETAPQVARLIKGAPIQFDVLMGFNKFSFSAIQPLVLIAHYYLLAAFPELSLFIWPALLCTAQ